ncbi:V-type ATPase 116kDa subunit family protein [Nocardia sp. NPDC051981]|uniref:V-type ATPase 116kDa subunit family protein n=1 Tax=Nocardia sp. NPDC051981 TaxID=3155417 RepID=UPI0034194E24
MNLRDDLAPVRMRRVALIAPSDAMRAMLIETSAAGVVQLDDPATGTPAGAGADNAELDTRVADAVRRRGVAALAGWCPEPELVGLTTRLTALGAGVVPLPTPPGIDPPTLLTAQRPLRKAFAPLVGVYGVLPYRDLDPTVPAGIAYVVMFGMMFGDAGHGLLLLAAAAVLASGRVRRVVRARPLWPFVAGAGLTATLFGVLYGEFFGPTGVLPVVWLSPLDAPLPLLGAGVAVGAALLALAHVAGAVNRWREGGLRLALYSATGIAGAALFLGVALITAGALVHSAVFTGAGIGLAVVGVILSLAGTFTESGGGPVGAAAAGIGVFDLVVRLGSNLVSFARLAAFGMTHAALGWVVWSGTVAAAGSGRAGPVLAVVVFVLGNAVAFALEALVAGVQALRLEFYELFSHLFTGAGRPFVPWRIRIENPEGSSC